MKKKPVNSRRKGACIELKACKFLASLGFEMERTAQYCGKTGRAADIRSKSGARVSLCRIHIEVKGDRKIGLGTQALHDACKQASRDAAFEANIPCVLWWEHMKGWRLTAFDVYGLYTIADDSAIREWLTLHSYPLD